MTTYRRSIALTALLLLAACGGPPPAYDGTPGPRREALGGSSICTTFFVVPTALVSGDTSSLDKDGDGLVDGAEEELANCFVPEYHFDSAENALEANEPHVLFTASPIGLNDQHHLLIHLHFVEVWQRDGGFIYCTPEANWCDDHAGDAQSVDINVELTSAHTAQLSAPFNDQVSNAFTMNGTHQLIFPSAGKHHEYTAPRICPDGGDFSSCKYSSGVAPGGAIPIVPWAHYDRADGGLPARVPSVSGHNLGQLESFNYESHPQTTPKGFINHLNVLGAAFGDEYVYDLRGGSWKRFFNSSECDPLFNVAGLQPPAPPAYSPVSISSLFPSAGVPAGSTKVAIQGANFDVKGQTSVMFGDQPALSVTCSSPTQCVAFSPPGSGEVDLTVAVGYFSASSKYWYSPSITSVSPATGKAGDKVTIHGYGFNASAQVRFSGYAASASCYSSTCTATVPDGGWGQVDVSVVVDNVVTAAVAADRFTYICTPIACGGFQCGHISNGCGGYIDCSCASGASCHQNACVPTTPKDDCGRSGGVWSSDGQCVHCKTAACKCAAVGGSWDGHLCE
jgi:hypothetical protein